MDDVIAALQGSDGPDRDAVHKALSVLFNKLNGAQDSTRWSFSLSAPDDMTGDANLGVHNFMLTATKQF